MDSRHTPGTQQHHETKVQGQRSCLSEHMSWGSHTGSVYQAGDTQDLKYTEPEAFMDYFFWFCDTYRAFFLL